MIYTKVRNFTPHEVKVILSTRMIIIPVEGIARLETTVEDRGYIGEIRLIGTTFGTVTGLPEPEDGVVLIVSSLVKTVLSNRHDLVVPTQVLRDPGGVILGCRALSF